MHLHVNGCLLVTHTHKQTNVSECITQGNDSDQMYKWDTRYQISNINEHVCINVNVYTVNQKKEIYLN